MEAAGRQWILHGSRSDEFTVWNLSDLHMMSRACAEKDLRRDVDRIRDDPYSFWLGGGDYCEFIGATDKRFDPDAVADYISISDLAQIGRVGYERVRDLFKPIAHKCLGLLLGNHEKKYCQHMEQNDRQVWLCQELGVLNLEYCALLDVVFVRKAGVKIPAKVAKRPPVKDTKSASFRVFAHHGAGYAQTPGGKLNRLVQFMQSFDADIYFTGHVHDQVGRREPRLGANADCTKLVAQERIGVVSGSYLKTYAQGVTTYGEQKGYRPVSLGASFVRIKPETREVRGEI